MGDVDGHGPRIVPARSEARADRPPEHGGPDRVAGHPLDAETARQVARDRLRNWLAR